MKRQSTKVLSSVQRCGWLKDDPEYIRYHDEEWGRPEHDSLKLFEMLCLEGQQAGLSWITVLKKRNHYRKVFHNFNPHKISTMHGADIEKLSCDAGIIRHKLKIEAIVNNAKCYLKMEQNDEDFSNFIWSFVEHNPIVNNWTVHTEIPSKTPISDALSKALKERGFKFIGSTICYAFMQACGLVNDHTLNCFSRDSRKRKRKSLLQLI